MISGSNVLASFNDSMLPEQLIVITRMVRSLLNVVSERSKDLGSSICKIAKHNHNKHGMIHIFSLRNGIVGMNSGSQLHAGNMVNAVAQSGLAS